MKQKVKFITIGIVVAVVLIVGACFIFNQTEPSIENSSSVNSQTNTSVNSQTNTSSINNEQKPNQTQTNMSWANDVWLNKIDKTLIKSISISSEKVDGLSPVWKYNGVTIGLSGDTLSIYTPKRIKLSESVENMFADLIELEQIHGLEWLDFSESKNLNGLFKNCTKLKDIDLSDCDFGNAESMNSMFSGCKELSSAKLSVTKLKEVRDTASMFEDCQSLNNIIIPEMPNLITVEKMFFNVGSTTSVNEFSAVFNVSKCKNFNAMFAHSDFNDYSFVTQFDTTSMETCVDMFKDCPIRTIDLSSWKTSSLTNINNMFLGCASLQSINLNGWDCSSLESAQSAFDKCTGVKTIVLNWQNVLKLKNTNSMFQECCEMETIDITCFNGLELDTANQMFYSCDKIVEIKCSDLKASSSINMFLYCSELQGGTAYNESCVDASMATTSGYFTN